MISSLLSRIFLCSFIFCTTSKSESLCHSTDVVENWVATYIKPLKTAEQQIIANMLNLSYMMAQVDRKLRYEASECFFNSLQLFCQSKQSQDISNVTKTLSKQTEQLAILSTKHQQIFQTWNHCITYIETTNNSVQEAIEFYKELVQHELCTWANQHQCQLSENLEQSSREITNAASSLNQIATLYKAIVENSKEQKKDDVFFTVNHIDLAIRSTLTLYSSSKRILSQGKKLECFGQDMQLLTEYFCSIYYHALYQYITKKSDSPYLYLLFNSDGFIPADSREIILADINPSELLDCMKEGSSNVISDNQSIW